MLLADVSSRTAGCSNSMISETRSSPDTAVPDAADAGRAGISSDTDRSTADIFE